MRSINFLRGARKANHLSVVGKLENGQAGQGSLKCDRGIGGGWVVVPKNFNIQNAVVCSGLDDGANGARPGYHKTAKTVS